MAPPEAQSFLHSSVVRLDPTTSPTITSIIPIGYAKKSLADLVYYVPEEAEELEIFDGPWDPDLRHILLQSEVVVPVGEDLL